MRPNFAVYFFRARMNNAKNDVETCVSSACRASFELFSLIARNLTSTASPPPAPASTSHKRKWGLWKMASLPWQKRNAKVVIFFLRRPRSITQVRSEWAVAVNCETAARSAWRLKAAPLLIPIVGSCFFFFLTKRGRFFFPT